MPHDIVSLENYSNHKISTELRKYGKKVRNVDFDLLGYTKNGKPTHIIEFKHFNVRDIDLSLPKVRSMTALADAGSLPFFCVVYWVEEDEQNKLGFTQYYVIAINDLAEKVIGKPERWLSQLKFCELIHFLEEETLSPDVASKLNKKIDKNQQLPRITR